jgi:hypothetical protein
MIRIFKCILVGMIQSCVNKLIDDMNPIKETIHLDLVLDGGAFNGSFLIGALFFLREMERRNYVKIHRISGVSIGSVAGIFYKIDKLDLFEKLYSVAHQDLTSNYSVNFIKYVTEFSEFDIHKLGANVFIAYNNVPTRQRRVIHRFKSVQHLKETVIRSCYAPFIVTGDPLYKRKYMDGINPHLFAPVDGRRILHLDLLYRGSVMEMMNIRNEHSAHHRVLLGVLDIHSFFIKGSSTKMCSFVNDWWFHTRMYFKGRQLVEYMVILAFYLVKTFVSDTTDINLLVTNVTRFLIKQFCV